MKIESRIDGNFQLMGTGTVELGELSSPETHDIRVNLAINPVKFTRIPQGFSPELQLSIDVTASPNFYARYVKLEEISFSAHTTSKENLSQLQDFNSNPKSSPNMDNNKNVEEHKEDGKLNGYATTPCNLLIILYML